MKSLNKPRILVVDDDRALLVAMSTYLDRRGFEVVESDSCKAARANVASNVFDAVILDHSLQDGNALDLLPELQAASPGVPVIILTGFGSIDLAVQAVKLGAEQFLTKPIEMGALAVVLERAIENHRNRQSQAAAASGDARAKVDPFLGESSAIRSLASDAKRVADSECSVLIQGETGSGKGVLAKWIHENSRRCKHPFIDLNCAGFNRELLDTELFGHEKGAFTGAVTAKAGLFEHANRGTVFLDEIGDMDLLVQPKLLKVLEEKRFRHVGGLRDYQSDVRLISASHQDLGSLVRKERFRADLYFRISTVTLRVPPLRERKEDIPTLVQNLLQRLASALGKQLPTMEDSAIEKMMCYSWPGNVRELKNVLERALILCGNTIPARALRFDDSITGEAEVTEPSSIRVVEQRHIERVLREQNWNVQRAAKQLGIPRSTLYQRIKEMNIVRSSNSASME